MDFGELTVAQLKDKCAELKIPKTGKKAELVSRVKLASTTKPKRGRPRSQTPKKSSSKKQPKNAGSSKKAAPTSRSKSPAPRSSSRKAPRARSTPRKPSSTKKKSSSSHSTAKPPYAYIFEPSPSSGGILTESGAQNIANHKYVAGGNTSFDNFMNPYWNSWVEFLPLWMAPNLVTTSGGLFCLMSFAVTWYVNANFEPYSTPYFVLMINGFCTWAYYTLDCMDGKQARRTGTSSPLGQLFDHGCDCVCNLAHLSTVMAVLNLGPTPLAIAGQVILQFSFFTAQWQEYHTGALPHKFGELGVTEVNHFTAAFSFVFGLLEGAGFLDTGEFFNSVAFGNMKINEMFIWGWIVMNAVLLTISVGKTLKAAGVECLKHLATPFLASVLGMFLVSTSPDVLTSNLRPIMLSLGFFFCLITNKMIVFSMAKMTFAAFQVDVLPLLAMVVLVPKMDGEQIALALKVLTGWQAIRLIYWCRNTIIQLCEKLDINCFTIKEKGD